MRQTRDDCRWAALHVRVVVLFAVSTEGGITMADRPSCCSPFTGVQAPTTDAVIPEWQRSVGLPHTRCFTLLYLILCFGHSCRQCSARGGELLVCTDWEGERVRVSGGAVMTVSGQIMLPS